MTELEANFSDTPRVLHVIGQLVPGGSEKMTCVVAREFRRRGGDHQIAVLGPIDPEFIASLDAGDVPVHQVDAPRSGIRATRAISAVAQLGRDMGAEIIQGHSWKSSVVAGLAGTRLRVGRVATLHRVYYPRLQHAVDPLMQRAWDRVVVDSHAVSELLQRECRISAARTKVIPNFVSDELFAAGREARPEDEQRAGRPTRVLVAAHFSREKGQRYAIEALAHLEAQGPGRFEFDFLGDGPLLDDCKQLAERLGVAQRARFHGRRSDLVAWLERSDVVLLTSEWEGFGLILAEAMALRIPTVAFSAGGTAEVIEDDATGALVPHGDVPGLGAALERLHADPELARAMGDRGREAALARFSSESILRSYHALYADTAKVR